MRNKDKHIADALGINDVEEPVIDDTVEEEVHLVGEYDDGDEPHTFDDDFLLAQKTLRDMLEVASKAVKSYNEIAEMEESPRHFEVLGTLISNANDTAERLMKLHTDRLKHQLVEQKVDEGQSTPPSLPAPNDTRAIAFVGTTADLLDEIRREQEKSIIDVTPDDETKD
jgi:hypothetical protein